MDNARQLSRDLFNSTNIQANATTTAPAAPNATAEQKPPATHALIEADKDIVISDPHKKAIVPQAMDVTMNKPAESLPVYTQKKWIPNKEEIEEENLKKSPTFAKIKAPESKKTSFTVLPDQKPELMVQVDTDLVDLQNSVKSTFASKPHNEMEAV